MGSSHCFSVSNHSCEIYTFFLFLSLSLVAFRTANKHTMCELVYIELDLRDGRSGYVRTQGGAQPFSFPVTQRPS